MTLSLQKLWAGSGYEYLARQVARLDATHQGRGPLASYYSERGETPGVWVGCGVAGLGGLAVGDVVTAEQMRSLFGAGLHPLGGARREEARLRGASVSEQEAAARLGSPFRFSTSPGSVLEAEVERRLAGSQPSASSTHDLVEARTRVVSEVAAEWFAREVGRAPRDARELAGAVARSSRPRSKPVAGFDLTFSPVKSVSALWAVADLSVAAEIERAHRAAVDDALRFIEQRALFTREGTNGVRQVEVRGLVATAFTHRDSRAGDPDLHTHVAVANKVQTLDGRWLAVDGRVLYAATVAASETYNTALERHLGERLGVRFEERGTTEGRRPVREVVGVDPALTARWSSRRQSIDVRRGELSRRFQTSTGRPPTRVEAWRLAQQATLETRDRKHEPRTLAEQRSLWHDQALKVLGSGEGLSAMVTRTLHPAATPSVRVDADWIAAAAARVLTVLEGERATWQPWHVRAETQRQTRSTDLLPGMSEHVVDLVVGEVVARSVRLGRTEAVRELPVLRRSDGTSVYAFAGTEQFTSSRVLAAEQRVLAAAGRHDGRRVAPGAVDVALAGARTGGLPLNDGQEALVRALLTSGARVQLALAPAGTGKTTALEVLASAWADDGGTVVGLAPSAAAAAVLGEHLPGPTDTLAKLVWSLEHPSAVQPGWVSGIDARTLVVVDEAGLADTPSLDAAIGYVVGRGGSVRLVGDDRQLGAVGAGGLLRDLDVRHGAARLSEVVRFHDRAEAAASLALRDGRPEALGFYLDEGRVHVGDSTTAADQLFTAWTADRAAGLDSLMLAPTNDLVADLNARARSHYLAEAETTAAVTLADGNPASAGDLILTRTNDRRLRTSRTSWVRNGDRWVVDTVHPDGAITARALTGGHGVRLPTGYVAASVQLGYASTVHTAQGVTCDTVHGLVTGHESRPQLYTLLTRGRTANHLYLQLDDRSGVHDLSRPSDAPPQTPTEILEHVLARDTTMRSATGHRDRGHDPAVQLAAAAGRYVDALHRAAHDTAPSALAGQLSTTAQRLVPGITDAPAWPTLLSTLLLASADGDDPVRRLRLAVATGPLSDAHDTAAVLHNRVTHTVQENRGPLPWLPQVPGRLRTHPTWGPYLDARSALINDLAVQVGRSAREGSPPAWATEVDTPLPRQLAAEIALWRAATGIPDEDLHPTGTAPPPGAARRWQQHLDQRLRGSAERERWTTQLSTTLPRSDRDAFQDRLAGHLTRLAATGVDVGRHVSDALTDGPLPDDHAAAALWWRLQRRLPPNCTGSSQPHTAQPYAAPPSLFAPIDEPPARSELEREGETDSALLVAGMLRLVAAATRRHAAGGSTSRGQRESAARNRLLLVNEWTLAFYRQRFPGSWSAGYLAERCGLDLALDERFQPGHAPAGWTAITTHLHQLGVTDDEMLQAGVASRSARGHLVDRFRDRLILPIRNGDHELVGFVGRRHPDTAEDGGPKYLNTSTTALFVKGTQLYGNHLLEDLPAERPNPRPTVVPVLVEGPIDAIAVTCAAPGRYVGVAALGTALTTEQTAEIARVGVDPIVATDADPAGHAASRRAFWLLVRHHLDPLVADLPAGLDPAALLHHHGSTALLDSLDRAHPLAERMLHDLQGAGKHPARRALLQITAARPPQTWITSLQTASDQLKVSEQSLREELLPLAQQWTRDPDRTAQSSLGTIRAGATRSTTARDAQNQSATVVPVDDHAGPLVRP